MITLEVRRKNGWNMVTSGTNRELMYEAVNAIRRDSRGKVAVRLMQGEGDSRTQVFYAKAGRRH